MDETTLQTILMLCAAALALYLLCIRYDPQRPHARILRHSVTGLLLLTVWNLFPLPHLGMNPLSAVVTGALGLPGLGLMAVVNLLP
ncbi:MAG: pro-sigmaK processing inhibitor BofA family protein [Clostridia bacterium]|nr:pro-sigmaK processing inhibitor BofA family protein [Clostridia bacterium]